MAEQPALVWHPPTQDVFAAVDPELWETGGHDPVNLLGASPQARLEELADDTAFLRGQRGRVPTSGGT